MIHLLKVIISDSRLSYHIILLLSSTLMKLLTCRVGLLFLIHFLIWKFSGCYLLQVIETEASYAPRVISCFDFIRSRKSQSILFDCPSIYVIVSITLCHFVSHIPLIAFSTFLSLGYIRIPAELQ